jgi:hypothetical protein
MERKNLEKEEKIDETREMENPSAFYWNMWVSVVRC